MNNPIDDLEKSTDVVVETDSILVNDNICFINTTQTIDFNFFEWDSLNSIQCSIKIFQNQNGDIRDHDLFVDTEQCSDKSCLVNYDRDTFINETILIGSPVTCDNSIFGVINNGM